VDEAKTGITGHVRPGAFVSGSPHLDIMVWRKFWAAAPRLYDLLKEFKRLQARVDDLEKGVRS
jgi:UDP-3-O-[3-hydroxymyristoyl] glucosamine N-acyltransferase